MHACMRYFDFALKCSIIYSMPLLYTLIPMYVCMMTQTLVVLIIRILYCIVIFTKMSICYVYGYKDEFHVTSVHYYYIEVFT